MLVQMLSRHARNCLLYSFLAEGGDDSGKRTEDG